MRPLFMFVIMCGACKPAGWIVDPSASVCFAPSVGNMSGDDCALRRAVVTGCRSSQRGTRPIRLTSLLTSRLRAGRQLFFLDREDLASDKLEAAHHTGALADVHELGVVGA